MFRTLRHMLLIPVLTLAQGLPLSPPPTSFDPDLDRVRTARFKLDAPARIIRPGVAVQAIGKYVIVSIGESYASGEGTPSRASNVPSGVLWQPLGPLMGSTGGYREDDGTGKQCHHSRHNGRALSAIDLNSLANVEVSFASFACSGSTINQGVIGPYDGIDPGRNIILQILQVQEWLNTLPPSQRRIDAMIISVGGNDVGFGQVVRTCLNPLELFCHQNAGLLGVVSEGKPNGAGGVVGFLGLRSAYDGLEQAINSLSHKPRHVILTEYPDPTRDEDGDFCHDADVDHGYSVDASGHPAWFGGSFANISRDESRWMYESVVVPLNRELREIARSKNVLSPDLTRPVWHYVPGMMEMTRHHGFCSSDRWVKTIKDSFDSQGDVFGTAHPNLEGHHAYRLLLTKKLVEVLSMPEAPAIEVGTPFLRTRLLSGAITDMYTSEGNRAKQIRVEVSPTAHDLEVTVQFSYNQPDSDPMRNSQTVAMTRDNGLAVRQIYFADLPGSNQVGAGGHIHYRIVIRYGLPGRAKTGLYESAVRKWMILWPLGFTTPAIF